ncbi:DUF169 domain-containing protein [Azospirillum doebereinerae]|uniref:DUF169 domain-containing protein n=1 Tax=Azospirillum doebereinerae TaxID=92933 RepID=A0A433J4A2_9PROT|nr:DUF169 domain-containing protein [Azospirillum doebereinerae]MCG5238324.1 DUF169 domain-containing protein [Azospirillum doebereinerae]RUQ66793.1 hypothetical protein EJ913_21645 [Azospirillum doebereinerae]
MTAAKTAKTPKPVVGAAQLGDLAQELTDLLRLRTLPIGMKLFEDADAMRAVPGLRTPTPERRFSTCQLVTQARIGGLTLGIVGDSLLPNANCGAVVGINPLGAEYSSGDKMAGVWFRDHAAARAHQAAMPRVEPGRYRGLAVSPLRMRRLDPPDIVLFYATPGQMILFINGLQWKRYRRFTFGVTGESACADSWGQALASRKPSLSIPCYAERRYGGVADDELLMALPPRDFASAIEGLKALGKSGLRYPILPYGTGVDPAEGLSASYGPTGKQP